jgi:phage shock protein C
MERAMSEFDGTGPKRRLMRRPDEGKMAGVCAGLAEYYDADVTLVRLVWVVLSIWGAIVLGVIAYVAAWLIMPRADGTGVAPVRARVVRSRSDKRIAGVCGGLAEYFDVDPTIMRIAWVVVSIVLGAGILGVIAYLIAWFIIPQAPAAALSPSPSVP